MLIFSIEDLIPPESAAMSLIPAAALILIMIFIYGPFRHFSWPKIARKQMIDIEKIDNELKIDINIYNFNQTLSHPESIKNPTYDELMLQNPLVTLQSRTPDSEKLQLSTLTYSRLRKRWNLVAGWDGAPANCPKTSQSVIRIIPTDKQYSYSTTEIWHYRRYHKHTRHHQPYNSVNHVTWHIRKGP